MELLSTEPPLLTNMKTKGTKPILKPPLTSKTYLTPNRGAYNNCTHTKTEMPAVEPNHKALNTTRYFLYVAIVAIDKVNKKRLVIMGSKRIPHGV